MYSIENSLKSLIDSNRSLSTKDKEILRDSDILVLPKNGTPIIHIIWCSDCILCKNKSARCTYPDPNGSCLKSTVRFQSEYFNLDYWNFYDHCLRRGYYFTLKEAITDLYKEASRWGS